MNKWLVLNQKMTFEYDKFITLNDYNKKSSDHIYYNMPLTRQAKPGMFKPL